MVEIPYEQLAPDTLQALIEEYVTRDGTDYGDEEIATERKVEQVKLQLSRREIVIVYDVGAEAANVLTRAQFSELQKAMAQQDDY